MTAPQVCGPRGKRCLRHAPKHTPQ
jgi:hypothetical protein